ncbi:hypothetical protein [Vreelandella sp. EE22]
MLIYQTVVNDPDAAVPSGPHWYDYNGDHLLVPSFNAPGLADGEFRSSRIFRPLRHLADWIRHGPGRDKSLCKPKVTLVGADREIPMPDRVVYFLACHLLNSETVNAPLHALVHPFSCFVSLTFISLDQWRQQGRLE